MPALLRSLLVIDPSSGKASARRTLEHAALRDADIDPARAPFLHSMLELELEPAAGARPMQDALDNATRMAREAHAVTTLVARLARRTRLLVTIEDVHWASPELLHHLHAVARAALCAPLVLVMTTRIESDPFDQAWRDELTGTAAVVLDLAPLSHGRSGPDDERLAGRRQRSRATLHRAGGRQSAVPRAIAEGARAGRTG